MFFSCDRKSLAGDLSCVIFPGISRDLSKADFPTKRLYDTGRCEGLCPVFFGPALIPCLLWSKMSSTTISYGTRENRLFFFCVVCCAFFPAVPDSLRVQLVA